MLSDLANFNNLRHCRSNGFKRGRRRRKFTQNKIPQVLWDPRKYAGGYNPHSEIWSYNKKFYDRKEK